MSQKITGSSEYEIIISFHSYILEDGRRHNITKWKPNMPNEGWRILNDSYDTPSDEPKETPPVPVEIVPHDQVYMPTLLEQSLIEMLRRKVKEFSDKTDNEIMDSAFEVMKTLPNVETFKVKGDENGTHE